MTSQSFLQTLFDIMVAAYVYYAWRSRIPLVWTQRAAQKIILDVIRAEMAARPAQKLKIYDLGSGLGGLCLAIARACPQTDVIGLEMAWPAWLFSLLRQKLHRQRNLHFLCCDFWSHNISDGDIVVCYLGDVVMQQMKDKLCREARPNRLFITNTFPLPKDWPPVERIAVPAALSKEIIVYRQNR